MEEKKKFLDLIYSNIQKHKFHVTIVNSDMEPRYAYTIGLNQLFGFELIFAGGIYYLKDELLKIFNILVSEIAKDKNTKNRKFEIDILGDFSLAMIHSSWSKKMMLGVFDYYAIDTIEAFQIIPDSGHYTLDIPDMTKEFNSFLEPVWKWLIHDWDYTVPKNSTVVTNLDALRGEPITEVTRWEDNEWDMFAGVGSEVQKEDIRITTLGTILGIDPTLLPAINLDSGKGLWRESNTSDWNVWG